MEPYTLGQTIAEWREARQMTQADLASEIGGVVSSVISHWEGGKRRPSLENFARIVRALRVNSEEVVAAMMQMLENPVPTGGE